MDLFAFVLLFTLSALQDLDLFRIPFGYSLKASAHIYQFVKEALKS